jgi:hypothetical protein
MAIAAEIIEAVANENLKTVGGFPASAANLMLSNAVSAQANQMQLAAAAASKATEMLIVTDVSESAGLASILQTLTKTAQTTPPVTG